MSTEPGTRRHVAALDGVRAFAVLSVLVYHTADPTGWDPADRVINAGWVGVDLFFVLSGFLITGILLDSKTRARFFRNFYLRRTLRIFPLYYGVLVLALLIAPHVLPVDDGIRTILAKQGWMWTYLQNIEELRHGGKAWHASWLQLTHMWSLSVEEQFYIVWPAVVFFSPRRVLIAIGIAIVVGAPVLRTVMLHEGVPAACVYSFTFCRLDTLALGALLAVLVRTRPAIAPRVARVLFGVGAVIVVGVVIASGGFLDEGYEVETIGFSGAALLFGGVVLWAAQPGASRGRNFLSNRWLTMVGRYSYGIYLLSSCLDAGFDKIYAVDRVTRLVHSPLVANIGHVIFVTIATTAIAALSWHVFEKRFLVLKDRWAPVEPS